MLFLRADKLPENISQPITLVNGRAVCIEIDENGGHADREPICESGKIWDQTVALKQLCGETLQVFFLRFNPDEYDGARSTLEQRIKNVGAHCRWLLDEGWRTFPASTAPHISYHYYHSKAAHQIGFVRARPESFHLYGVFPGVIQTSDHDIGDGDEIDELDDGDEIDELGDGDENDELGDGDEIDELGDGDEIDDGDELGEGIGDDTDDTNSSSNRRQSKARRLK